MSASALLITGWILIVTTTVMLLTYRLLLRYLDRQRLRFTHGNFSALHGALENRITLIDRWGVSLTIGIALYAALFLMYLLYRAFEKIGQELIQLLSYI